MELWKKAGDKSEIRSTKFETNQNIEILMFDCLIDPFWEFVL